jgi:hypothetical protein
MKDEYSALTSAPVGILRHGVPMDFEGMPVPREIPGGDEWIVGFAGSMSADCAWLAFLRALDHAHWRIAGRPVRLKVLSGRITVASRKPARIDYLGCLATPEEAQLALESCHLTYLPQPFAASLTDLARYSFPTKLTSYLSAGRPVFVHSPPNGSLAEFYVRNPLGALATSLAPESIVLALESLLGNVDAYRAASSQVRKTAVECFSDSVFHDAIDQMLLMQKDR